MTERMIQILAILAGSLPVAAMAQTVVMAQGNTLDTDGDGMVSFEELTAVYAEVTAETFAVVDLDGDGLLSPEEIDAAEEAGLVPPPDA